MNAEQIAHLIYITTQAYGREELAPEQFTDLVRGLQGLAESQGQDEAVRRAYSQICWRGFQMPVNG